MSMYVHVTMLLLFCVIRTNQMHFLLKCIPVISSTCFEQTNYSSSGGSLLYMQSVAFIVHLLSKWNLIVLAASQRGCTINAIDCMYSKLPAEDE